MSAIFDTKILSGEFWCRHPHTKIPKFIDILTCRRHVTDMSPTFPAKARSLRPHLSRTRNIHQQVVVADMLLEERAGVRYRANPGGRKDPIQCPYPGCPGVLSTTYMLRRHFWDLHPKDTMEIPREGTFPRCKHCTMQCNPRYPHHIHTQVCLLGAEQRTQRDLAITAALALCKLFHVEGELLEKVDLFRYLGQILAQDDDDIRAVGSKSRKPGGYGQELDRC